MEPNKSILPQLILLIIALVIYGNAGAMTVWDEQNDGDLGTDPSTPTTVNFSIGSNEIYGSVQAVGDTRDYFTFTLSPGQQLVGIDLLSYTDLNTNGPGNRGFHAIIAGATSFIPDPGTADNFLGGDHLDPGDADLLANLAAATLAGTGFDTPLGPGTYTYLIQQTGPQLTGYGVNFQVVPIPAAFWMLTPALALLIRTRRPV